MGANHSNEVLPSSDEGEPSIFLIPSTIMFSQNQIQILTNNGQSVNVPFGIDEVGAHRQRGKHLKTYVSSSPCSVDCISLHLLLQSDGIFLNFIYSSNCQSEVVIFMGGKDMSTDQNIKVVSKHKSVGPVSLEPGLYVRKSILLMTLSPTNLSMFPSFRTVIERICHQSFQSLVEYSSEYDIVLTISASKDSFAHLQSSSPSPHPPLATTLADSTRESVDQKASSFSIINGTLRSHFTKSNCDQQVPSSYDANKSGPCVITAEAYYTRVDTTQLQSTGRSVPLRVFAHRAKTSHGLVFLMQEIYGTKLRSGANDISSSVCPPTSESILQQTSSMLPFEKPNSSSDGCELPNGIELMESVASNVHHHLTIADESTGLMDSRGMESTNEEEGHIHIGIPSSDSSSLNLSRILGTDTNFSSYRSVQVQDIRNRCVSKYIDEQVDPQEEKSLENIDVSNSTNQITDNSNTNNNISIDDTSGTECIICLTEPINVAVYPCRHMSMCFTCASSLAANRNQCPLCRCPAQLLIHLKCLTNEVSPTPIETNI